MSDRSLSILSGIAKGVEKGVANLHNISLAKEKLRKEREEFTLNKKVKNAQLDVLEAKTSPEAMRESRAIFDMSVKKHEATMKKDEVLTNIAEIREQKQAMSLRKDQKILVASGISSLEDTGLSTEEATKRFLSPDQPSMFDVNAQDPFLSALGTAAREKIGLTKEQAKKKVASGGKEPTQSRRKVAGDVRRAISLGESRENVEDSIRFDGYEPEDFAEELKALDPLEGSEFPESSEIDKATKREKLFRQQKFDKRKYNGKEYELKEDNLWHLVRG